MSDLRDRLIAAKISGTRVDQVYYQFRTNENAADVAVSVVAEWLRRKAADVRATADLLPDTDEAEAIGAAKMLDFLADALAGGQGANQSAD